MEGNLAFGLLSIILLFAAKLFVTGSFSAMINARKSILRDAAEDEHSAAKRALVIGENAAPLLATLQFLTIMLNLTIIVVLSTTILIDLTSQIESSFTIDENLSLLGLAAATILFFSGVLMITDRLATAFVLSRAEQIAISTSRAIKILIQISAPMVSLSMRISTRLARLVGAAENMHLTTAEEIKTLVDAGSEEGVLEAEEKEMIYSIIRFGDTVAREVMVPRIDIIALEYTATLEEALSVIIKGGHSRIPVFQETIDNIVGVLYAKDLLSVWQKGEKPTSLEPLLRMPVFVPETKQASELLVDLQAQKTHLVFVVDEFGGTAGLLTIEDLLEEIVGEIQDEYDIHEEALYEKVHETEYVFNARVDLDDLNHLLDTTIPTDDNDTLGGYIFSRLGRVPNVNDSFEDHGLKFHVLSVTGRRIRKVSVQKIMPKSEEIAANRQTPEANEHPTPLRTEPLTDTGTS